MMSLFIFILKINEMHDPKKKHTFSWLSGQE